MGKHGKTRQKRDGPYVQRSAPYPKKARVEVTFDGVPPRRPAANGNSPHVNGISRPEPALSAIAKGKSKAEPSITSSVVQHGDDITPTGPPTPYLSTFMIVAGSYEKLLYGLEGSYASGSSKPSLKPVFIFPAHLACVKAVAASPGGKWLATGSEDEFIRVWDLRRRKEVGSLSQHSGSITSLHFPTSSHLVSTSVDGTLALFRTSDWALLKSLKGHSGRVNHVDVHPTGRVALSVGKDQTLKMWDLMRGRGASSLPLGTEAEMVKFSPRGTHFAVLYPKKVEIYSLTLKRLHTMTTTASRFNTLLFTSLASSDRGDDDNLEVLCVGTEKGVVEVYKFSLDKEFTVGADQVEQGETEEGEEGEQEGGALTSGATVELICNLTGHTNRIKSISALPFTSSSSGGLRQTVLLATASTDGLVNLYDIGNLASSSPSLTDVTAAEPVATYSTKGTRLTCLIIAEGRKQMLESSWLNLRTGEPDAEYNIDGEEDEEDDREDEEAVEYDSAAEDDNVGVEEDGKVEVEFEEDEEEAEYED